MEDIKWYRRLWYWYHGWGGGMISVFASFYIIYSFIGDLGGVSLPDFEEKPLYRVIAFILSLVYWIWKWWEERNKNIDLPPET